MKKSLAIFLFSLCTVQVLYAPPAVSAVEYRYNPVKPAVDLDMSLVDPAPPPEPAASTTSAPVLQPPKLKKPFFSSLPVVSPPAPVAVQAPVVPSPIKPAVVAKPAAVQQPAKSSGFPHLVRRSPVEEAGPVKTIEVKPVAPVAAEASVPAVTEPAPAPVAESAPVKTEAAVPTLSDLTLDFDAASSEISPMGQKKLDSLAAQMADAGDMRVQIRAYARGDEGQSSARRMALSRGLMVRSYLTDKGIKPIRLDVRALGSETDRQPIDRVDLVFVR
jgi:outer membrane protein OmpA-like peptidoglycan-associated protein